METRSLLGRGEPPCRESPSIWGRRGVSRRGASEGCATPEDCGVSGGVCISTHWEWARSGLGRQTYRGGPGDRRWERGERWYFKIRRMRVAEAWDAAPLWKQIRSSLMKSMRCVVKKPKPKPIKPRLGIQFHQYQINVFFVSIKISRMVIVGT